MNEGEDKPRSQADIDLEREIRAGREFSLEEAIGRMAGGGLMKGVSPLAGRHQAEAEIQVYLARHLTDAGGALKVVLLRRVGESDRLIGRYDQPLVVLEGYVQHVLASIDILADLVREADVEWGQAFGERPYFQVEGRPPNPDDPYTAESVRVALARLGAQLRADAGPGGAARG
jgi:hypothetical protein